MSIGCRCRLSLTRGHALPDSRSGRVEPLEPVARRDVLSVPARAPVTTYAHTRKALRSEPLSPTRPISADGSPAGNPRPVRARRPRLSMTAPWRAMGNEPGSAHPPRGSSFAPSGDHPILEQITPTAATASRRASATTPMRRQALAPTGEASRKPLCATRLSGWRARPGCGKLAPSKRRTRRSPACGNALAPVSLSPLA